MSAPRRRRMTRAASTASWSAGIRTGPDGLLIAADAAAHTKRVGFLVAHRPGFQAPTNAARSFATLDQLSQGRAAIHVISGGDDVDQQRDGDYIGKDERYARTDEYVGILKSIWTAETAGRSFRRLLPLHGRLARGEDARSSRASRSISAAPPMRRSRSPASMPTSTRSGARPRRRCARSRRGCARRRRSTAAR